MITNLTTRDSLLLRWASHLHHPRLPTAVVDRVSLRCAGDLSRSAACVGIIGTFLLCCGLIATTAEPTFAGPNQGGVLAVHASGNVFYTNEGYDYCNLDRFDGACDSATVQLPLGYPDSQTSFVWWIDAVFPNSPRLAKVTFGSEFDDGYLTFADWGACGDSEIATSRWPFESNEGTVVTWSPPRMERFVPVYWMAGYSYYHPGTVFQLRGHPTHQGRFGDDSVPEFLDPIADYGALGFGLNAGYYPCATALGACCFGSVCTELDESECDTAGGIWMGRGSLCELDACIGACCFGSLCADLGSEDCTINGGTWLGNDSSCDGSPCIGACCTEDGQCSISTPSECTINGGVFLEYQMSCDPGPCFGACCLPSGVCVLGFPTQCAGSVGEFLGWQSPCTPDPCPDPGACCFGDGSCQALLESTCEDLGGSFLGSSVSCDADICLGACCLDDGSCGYRSAQECLFLSGEHLGNGSLCSPNPCPQPQACCFDDGHCELLFETSCSAIGGLFLGGPCDPSPCPPAGACCRANGTCVFLTDGACSQFGGAYQGNGTPCDPNPCPVLGACCFGQVCFQVTEFVCLENGGQYLGNSTLCGNEPCSTLGACCLEDGQCVVTLDFICGQYEGTWTVGVGCTADRCEEVIGACCSQDGSSCHVLTGIDCAGEIGMFLGDGSVCDPNPCSTAGWPDEVFTPDHVMISQPWPNPSGGVVRFTVGLPEASTVRLRVFDANGRLVETVVDGEMGAGVRLLSWDGKGRSSGVYYVELRAGKDAIGRSFVLIR